MATIPAGFFPKTAFTVDKFLLTDGSLYKESRTLKLGLGPTVRFLHLVFTPSPAKTCGTYKVSKLCISCYYRPQPNGGYNFKFHFSETSIKELIS